MRHLPLYPGIRPHMMVLPLPDELPADLPRIHRMLPTPEISNPPAAVIQDRQPLRPAVIPERIQEPETGFPAEQAAVSRPELQAVPEVTAVPRQEQAAVPRRRPVAVPLLRPVAELQQGQAPQKAQAAQIIQRHLRMPPQPQETQPAGSPVPDSSSFLSVHFSLFSPASSRLCCISRIIMLSSRYIRSSGSSRSSFRML